MFTMYALRSGVVLLGASLAIGITVGTAAQNRTPVTLTAIDGSMSISGSLISVGDGSYLVKTAVGELRLPADQVTCEGIGCPGIAVVTPKFGVHGSRTVGTDLMPNLLRGYARKKGANFELVRTDNPDERTVLLTYRDGTILAEIDLRTYGSGSAFMALADGVAEIGMADRQMKDDEAPVLAAAGIPDLRKTGNETVIGLDGLVVMVHPDNPVRYLTTEQLARIYSGESTNWAEFGGPDVPIVLNTFGPNFDDRALFVDHILTPHGRIEAADAIRHATYNEATDSARNDLGGIAYASQVYSEGTNVLSIREDCGLLTTPTDFRMKTESYGLSRRLYLYTKPGSIHPVAQEFLDWTLTDEAQPYIVETGFIDRAHELMQLEDMGAQMVHTMVSEPEYDPYLLRKMLRELRNAERLSMEFQFALGSATLDAQARRELEELAKQIEAGQFPVQGKEMILVGFADSIGAFSKNRSLARRRAAAVRTFLASRLQATTLERVGLATQGYGELMPQLCNETAEGRYANRRVEVWLRLKDTGHGVAVTQRRRQNNG